MLQVLSDELLNDTIEINQKSRQEYCIASTMISDTRVFDVMHAAPSPLKYAFNVGFKRFWWLQVMNQSISWIYKQDVWLIWTYSAPKKEIGCPLMVEFSCQLNGTITNCLVNKTTTRQKGTALQVIKPP